MIFPAPLERGILIRRYKRFLADVVLADGSETTVHVPNSGSMLGMNMPGLPVWLSRSADPKRKLPLTLEMVQLPTGLVGVNTMRPNRLAEAAIGDSVIPELTGYDVVRREVRYDSDSRIDLLLGHPDRAPAYVEVKNVTLSRSAGLAEFPDCVTARGAKHLAALERVVEAGGRAVMLFIAQRGDCDRFVTADDLDPAYGAALRRAEASGVEVLCYDCHLTPETIRLNRPLGRPGATG